MIVFDHGETTDASSATGAHVSRKQDIRAKNQRERYHGFACPYSKCGSARAIKSVHRIAATGARVPRAAGDFVSLQSRYEVPSELMDNLAKNGFAHPTAIQSQAIPVLMEVRKATNSRLIAHPSCRRGIWPAYRLRARERP
jgi:hypothetical protein